jgi:hypothetical protein
VERSSIDHWDAPGHHLKGLAFRIHGLAEKLKNLPVVKRAARHHFFDDDGSDGDDGSHGNDGSQGGDGGTPTN